ncbi:MAG: hypothetical protein ACT4O4_10750, partial [Nitrospiraceae bacterium]
MCTDYLHTNIQFDETPPVKARTRKKSLHVVVSFLNGIANVAESGEEIDAREVFWFDQGMPFRPLHWPQYYYFASVPLLLIDWLAGANVRAVGFAAYPSMRMIYYLACLLCGMV